MRERENNMKEKVALITGSRRGIGEAVAYRLAQSGFNIIINDKEDIDSINKVVKKVKKDYNVSKQCCNSIRYRNRRKIY